ALSFGFPNDQSLLSVEQRESECMSKRGHGSTQSLENEIGWKQGKDRGRRESCCWDVYKSRWPPYLPPPEVLGIESSQGRVYSDTTCHEVITLSPKG
ncbi:Uncharacterized protein TCM_022625, partial [Theobroma cacao]